MPATFTYKVRDQVGKVIEGQLEADDQALVVEKLRSMGYTPISISKRNESKLTADLNIPGLTNRVPLKDISVMARQFATMINSGLSILRSLAILAQQTENKELARVLGEVRHRRRAGCVALGRAQPAPEGVQPAVRRHGALRGVVGNARLRARCGSRTRSRSRSSCAAR